MARSTLLSFFMGLLLHNFFTAYGSNFMFSNTWTVQIRGGDRVVLAKLARKHGFVNETQVRRGKAAVTPKLCVRKKVVFQNGLFP